MIQRPHIEEIAEQITRLLPVGGEALGADLRRNVKAALSAALARMDLVTREEFDVQSQVLARTRARLEAMEKQLAAMEEELRARIPGSDRPAG